MAKDINLTSKKWNDIVFENKLKDYGAYEMRQTSSRRHVIAFIIVAAFVAFVALLPTLMQTVANLRPKVDNIDTDVTLADLELLDEIEKQDQIVQETAPPPPPLKSTIQFVAPVIVEDDELQEDQQVKSQEELQESTATVSLFNVEGTDEAGGVDLAELEDQRRQAEDEEKNKVYDFVEQMPAFPGGDAALRKYLSDNIRYPAVASETGIQGRVTVRFTVSRDGSITNIVVLQSPDESLSTEATRIVKSMPKWIPGKYNGRAVNVNFNLPVVFRLE